MKFHMSKDPLGNEVGPTMAALLYYYHSQIIQNPTANADLCIVYDVRDKVSHVATGKHTRLLRQVQDACSMIESIWPTL